ncbi:MAG: FtsH protease activity modulator HflK [Pseudomonadota bacterium]|nr:FtsH protease activity modulator HflK [Pseudomonadota bacterium]
MAWNQPGSDNQDPWGQGNGQQGPPDLDQVIRDLRRKLGALFGGRGGGSSGGSGSGGRSSKINKTGFILIVVGVLVGWLATGFYVVEQGEQSVELRFGAYKEIKEAGLRWRLPYPIETNELVNVQKIRTVEVGYRTSTRSGQLTKVPSEALMLTTDENIIDIQFAVQFDIRDPKDLLFNVIDEQREEVVRQATESAVREVVGLNTMDYAITGGRAEIAQKTRVLLQEILDRYESGIKIRNVEMQNAQPPEEVKPAFDDAVKAREDQVRLKNEAEAYSNDILPRARGQAARMLQEAEAYEESKVALAAGEASRFSQVLSEYQKAPEITRDRLYLEAMEGVLGNSTKLVIDQNSGGNNVMYLPLDQLIRNQQSRAQVSNSGTSSSSNNNNASNSVSGAIDGMRTGTRTSSRVTRF